MITIPVTYAELLSHKAANRIALNNVFYTVPVEGKSDFNVWAAYAADTSRVFVARDVVVPENFNTDFSEALLVETLNLG